MTKKERQAITASMPKCQCGNVRSAANTHCGTCLQGLESKREAEQEAEVQRRRNEFIDSLMREAGP